VLRLSPTYSSLSPQGRLSVGLLLHCYLYHAIVRKPDLLVWHHALCYDLNPRRITDTYLMLYMRSADTRFDRAMVKSTSSGESAQSQHRGDVSAVAEQ
jgi:hypothetical protein